MDLSLEEVRQRNEREFYSPVSKFMHNTMAHLTRLFLKTNITPNQITTFWIFMQLAGSILMVFGDYALNAVGVVLFVGAALLDYVDGQIARIKKIRTYKGIFLEELGIYLGSPLFFLGLSIGVASQYHDIRYFYLGVISLACILYSKLAIANPASYPEDFREQVLSLNKSLGTRVKGKKIIYLFLFFRRSQPLNFMLIGILLNLPRAVLIVYTFLYILEFCRRFVVQIWKLHQLDKGLAKQS
ncbi:CDP-alcohol phosphatidyltransferase family protein [Candidatus Woesearchaeota archaeon]|nr:CDP-alcohol phosphatidyltransferase family protein [Candidatus Woesearchaeota archaeon]